VHTLQLAWQPALALSVGLAAGAVVAPVVAPRVGPAARPYLRESALVAALYGLWQLAGSASLTHVGGAFDRARWIVRFEHGWLPSERSAQRLLGNSEVLARAANWYYAAMHFTALGLLLLWLFARHRSRYPRVRNVLVLLTGASLLIQLVPVAPPRLLPELGFVDTAARYGESVYAISTITIDQLSAMPSVHVGWALLVGWAVIEVSRSRYRWWVLIHPALTVFVVVATANHFWLDGIVAALLLAASIGLIRLSDQLRGSLRQSGRPSRQLSRPSQSVRQGRLDHGDAGGDRVGHLGQPSADPGEGDRAGDELVGPQRT
jgi:PAP2 superfamily